MRGKSAVLLLVTTVLAACGGGHSTTGPSTYGSIQATITGLPGGTAARVTLAGPGGLIRTFTASGILTGATPGTWTVQARHVAVGGLDYIATAPASITVVEHDTAAVAISYSSIPLSTVDYVIPDVQAIQSVQDDTNGVPLVAGRPALIRVFVTANQATGTVPAARLHLYGASGLFDSVTVQGPPVQVPLLVDRGNLTTSWNFSLTAAQVIKGLRVDAVVDPDDDIGEPDETDNRWPSAGIPLALDVRSVPAFTLRLVPVLQSVNHKLGDVTSANKASFADLATRIYPLLQVNVLLRTTYTTSAPVLQSDDGNGAWGQVLSEIYTLQQADRGNATYYGVVATTYSSGIAGLGYIGAPAAIGWDKQPSAGGVAAHELGHTFGRSHAPCGTSGDPSYPYPNAEIGVWGYDQGTGSLKDPAGFFDLMSYCSPVWISDYTYEGVLTYRAAGPIVKTAADSGLLIWGRIRGDSLIIEPAFVINAPARMPAEGGPYRIRGIASGGGDLFDLSFTGDEVPDLPGGTERHFAFVIPLAQAAPDRLESLVLTGPRGTALRRTAALAGAAPDVAITAAGPELVQVRWDPRYPMALVRDARSGEILSFARGGSALVAASGPVRVELSRGTGSVRGTVRK
jgi:hypothetical protein